MPLVEPSPEAYHHILRLRVVRHFTAEPVSPQDLAAVLEAGRWTGSSKNTQGWRFAVVDEEEGRMRLAEAGRYTDPVRRAPVAIALVRTRDGNDFDIGRLAQNVMLAAAARGLGSCPVTLHHGAEAARAIGLSDGYTCRFAVVLGHPDEEKERAARAGRGAMGRVPLDELVANVSSPEGEGGSAP